MIFHVIAKARSNAIIVEIGEGEQDILPAQFINKDPPQHQNKVSPQVPNDPPIGKATLDEHRDSMQQLAQALITQANREVVALG